MYNSLKKIKWKAHSQQWMTRRFSIKGKYELGMEYYIDWNECTAHTIAYSEWQLIHAKNKKKWCDVPPTRDGPRWNSENKSHLCPPVCPALSSVSSCGLQHMNCGRLHFCSSCKESWFKLCHTPTYFPLHISRTFGFLHQASRNLLVVISKLAALNNSDHERKMSVSMARTRIFLLLGAGC